MIKRKSTTAHRSNGLYAPSPLKRIRRTKDQINQLLQATQKILIGESGQITLRHLFYRLVGLGLIPKVEPSYKQLCKHVSNWRRLGDIPWDKFADSTRWHLRRETFDSVDAALANTIATYRRNLWANQPYYVEVWVEKDAIASILYQAAEPFGVPVFVARGFASLSSLYSCAESFKAWANAGKETIIYHFGDYDPSGLAACESITKTMRDDFGVEVKLVRAAVTKQQIQKHKLPTRPVKQSDTRAAKWKGGECVEIDSMPSAELGSLVESCITKHIDQFEWEQTKLTESMERETLETIRRNAA